MQACRTVDANLLESVAACFGALGAVDPGQLQQGNRSSRETNAQQFQSAISR